MPSATDRRRPLFARYYARLAPAMEARGLATLRQELLAGARGRVVEVGAGNGLNFPHYPVEVAEVLAVEPEPHLRQLAAEAAQRAPVPVTVLAGTAANLPLETASVDVGVASLVLCSVDDEQAALAELHRVIRPGGELRFLEHVRADAPRLRRLQEVAQATVWPLLAGGCHPARDTAAAIAAAGFQITALRRFRFPEARIPVPTDPHILGTAVRSDT